MRNLKKILALVLALVMSLSLMATAGAADFPDVKDDTSYKTAIEVLSGLGVFNGYKEDGTFRPDGEITRAETAAIIYRIVTGDVKDEQVKIYSDYGLFTDVPSTSWYAGYVNFCANAEYIKGDGKGHFNPNDKVEGYAALAMILRAIGYTANGSFTGSDWRVQTARVGESRKITKNITTGTLGSNADRKTVAEILYQAIMVDMVDHNVDNTFNGNQGYTTIPQTLGQKTFGLEQVSGVILANEWANLVSTKVLDADTTQMKVTKTYATQSKIAENTVLTLDSATEPEMQDALDAVGLTYDAHVANISGKEAHVLTLDKSDINVVAYNEGEGVYTASEHGNLNNSSWNTIEALAKTRGIVLSDTNETEYFINYATEWDDNCQSEYRISYAIAKESLNGLTSVTKGSTGDIKWSDYMNDLKAATNNGTIPAPAGNKYAGHYFGERTIKIDLDLDGDTDKPEESIECYVVAIVPENTINQVDLDIMRQIFYTADRIGTNGNTAEWLQNYAVGEVYVGTTSMKDYSDTMSWPQFKAEYFTVDVNSRKFSTCEIGNSLRVIDNNDDGVAEYVLRIDYTQDKIIGTVKSQPAGYSVAIGNYEGNLLYNPQADEITQGTVINYTEIDQKLYVWPAPVVTDSITNKNFQNITVTASNGETYNQSGIDNYTGLDENIMLMNQNTQYNMYMDVYGINIRSYELAQGTKYALLTEMYPTSDRNGNYLADRGAIAEVKIGEADVDEYPVNNRISGTTTGNWFFNPYIWTWSARGYSGVEAGNTDPSGAISTSWLYNANYLQPAVAHLGIGNVLSDNGNVVSRNVWIGSTTNVPAINVLQTAWSTNWYRYVAQANTQAATYNGDGSSYGVFNYRTATNGEATSSPTYAENATFSFTNVATYVDNDGTLTLGSASKLAKDRSTNKQLYRVSSDAAAAVAATGILASAASADRAMLAAWGHGTEAQLVAAYNRATGRTDGQTWFDAWTVDAEQDGTGIYPIYDTDYVQLDLTKGDMGQALVNGIAVKAGTRHFHIDDTYSVNYNTNGNKYVDATVNTEFYIVLPGNEKVIQYKVGYADLPTIESDRIRAAYAVAHNTSADKNNQDYWVADVVVIELSELTYDYDSISLAYYNPYVQNDFVRSVNSLNNEWRNLQPDYENKAMMMLTPKSGNFVNTAWGNESWSANTNTVANYWFWRLYQTELTAPGQLNVSSARKITKDYNDYGIYAGTATRIEELETSNYVDVSTQNTGCVQTYAIDVDYGESSEVPFYRIARTSAAYGDIYTASHINANQSLRWSDVKNGDRLIWVYDKAQSRIAFVIDLDKQGDKNYATPAWLETLYTSIDNDQKSGGSGLDIDGLIARATAVSTDPNATLAQQNAMIDEINAALANPNASTTNQQRSDLNSLLTALKNAALSGNKEAARAAAQAMADNVLKNAAAPDSVKTAVNSALATVLTSINNAADSDALEDIYENGEIVDATFKGVMALANAKTNAVSLVNDAVKDFDLNASANTALKGAYDALITKIVGCGSVTSDPNTSNDVAHWVNLSGTGSIFTTANESKAVKDAIDVAADAGNLAAAKAAAVEAVKALVPAGYEVYETIKPALKALTDSVNGCTDLDTLKAIAAGSWTSLAGGAAGTIYGQYQTLTTAVQKAQDEEKANEAIDKQVTASAGVVNGGASLDPDKLGYNESYEALGVSFEADPVDGTVTISYDKTALMEALANPTELQKQAMQTMRPNGTGNNLAVGVSFKAPEGAKSVKFYQAGAENEWPGVKLQNGYFVRWFIIANGTFDSDGNFTLTSVADSSMRTVTMQFYADPQTSEPWTWNSPIGSIVTRDVEINVA